MDVALAGPMRNLSEDVTLSLNLKVIVAVWLPAVCETAVITTFEDASSPEVGA